MSRKTRNRDSVTRIKSLRHFAEALNKYLLYSSWAFSSSSRLTCILHDHALHDAPLWNAFESTVNSFKNGIRIHSVIAIYRQNSVLLTAPFATMRLIILVRYIIFISSAYRWAIKTQLENIGIIPSVVAHRKEEQERRGRGYNLIYRWASWFGFPWYHEEMWKIDNSHSADARGMVRKLRYPQKRWNHRVKYIIYKWSEWSATDVTNIVRISDREKGTNGRRNLADVSRARSNSGSSIRSFISFSLICSYRARTNLVNYFEATSHLFHVPKTD